MIITYPLLTVTDDSGNIVSGAIVTIASVTDKAGTTVPSPGATVNVAGANVTVDYDAEAKGEAWVTLSISKTGSTFTNLNASPAYFLSKDPSRIENTLPSSGVINSNLTQVNGTAVTTKDGTAQAGSTSGTIVLDASDTAGTNYYVGRVITIINGTGKGQSRIVTANNGTSHVTNVYPDWVQTPASDSDYIFEQSSVTEDVINIAGVAPGTAPGGVPVLDPSGFIAAAVNAYIAGQSPADYLNSQGMTTTWVLNVLNGINNINNLSALAVLYGPSAMEVPASGSIAYAFTMLVKDAEGHLLDLSATPTVTAANAVGTDRSTNLSAVTHAGTGQYTFTYTVSSAAAQEGLTIKATGTASSDSSTRVAVAQAAVVAVDTATSIAAIKAKTDLIATNAADSPNAVTAQGTIATNLDAKVSTRSTYAGTDTPGTTTLLTRIPGTIQPQTGDAYARLGAPAGVSVSADIAAVKTSADAAARPGAQMDLVNAPNATALTAAANAILDLANAIDPAGGADSVRKALRLILAACAGRLSGASGVTNIITDTTGAKNRITATVDAQGDRVALVYDLT